MNEQNANAGPKDTSTSDRTSRRGRSVVEGVGAADWARRHRARLDDASTQRAGASQRHALVTDVDVS